MARRLLDNSVQLSVGPDTRPELRNIFASLPSVQRLAEAVAEEPRALWAIAVFVVTEGRKKGYAPHNVTKASRKVCAIGVAEDTVRSTVKALEEIAEDYARYQDDPEFPAEKKQELPSRFSSGISEAIVERFLLNSGRARRDTTRDARAYRRGEPINASNVDFVWARPTAKIAEIYECKNHPMRLVGAYQTRNAPGNQVAYRKSQLFLMLRIVELLRGASWNVSASCVSLRPRLSFKYDIDSLADCPSDLKVYGIDDFGKQFPPPLTCGR